MKRLALVILLAAFLGSAVTAWAANPVLHRYSTGKRVGQLQWLLGGHRPAAFRIKAYRGSVTRRFDARTEKAVRNMQWRLGVPRPQINGRVSPFFFSVLHGQAHRPQQWRVTAGNRLVQAQKEKLVPPPLTGKRAALVSDANYLIRNASLVHYSQRTRMQIVRLRLRIPLTRAIYEDCSSAITGLYWLAAGGTATVPHPTGLPDPNGYTSPPFNGFGYTGTMATHGRVVWRLGQSLGLLRPGDLILYAGGFPFRHVTMYLGAGRVFSHGTELAPFNLPVLYRADAVEARRYF